MLYNVNVTFEKYHFILRHCNTLIETQYIPSIPICQRELFLFHILLI